MKFELIVEAASGDKTKIYSPVILDNGHDITLYESFVSQNLHAYRREIHNLDTRLQAIGNECGLFEEYFEIGAGRYGQNICKFKDRPRAKLRLYFIQYSNAIIVGGGGVKPKGKRTTQDIPELQRTINLLGLISDTLKKAQKKGHFKIEEDGTMISTTNFIYDTEDYE